MDDTERKMTKIAREVSKFTVQTMKEDGIGTAEFDVIHLVRHNPGITQTKVRETLKIDKGAAAKRVANLETKGYLIRKPNPDDGRSQLLYATEKAEKFLGVTLVAEKEMVFIVVKSEQKNEIMKAIMEKAGLESKAKAIVFSLPVSATAGMRLMEEAVEEEL